jgi:hypothetical protein
VALSSKGIKGNFARQSSGDVNANSRFKTNVRRFADSGKRRTARFAASARELHTPAALDPRHASALKESPPKTILPTFSLSPQNTAKKPPTRTSLATSKSGKIRFRKKLIF